MRGVLSVCILLLVAVSAHAQIVRANDTGGSIPWSSENEIGAHQIAAQYCAIWNKYHRITSVRRRQGDFIKFDCLPDIDSHAQPGLRTGRADLADARTSGTNPTPPSDSAQPGQAAADPVSTQFRQLMATFSAEWEGATNAITELPAHLSRALGNLSAVVQPQMPEGEKERPKPPGRALVDSSAKETDGPALVESSSTYARAE